MHTLSAWLPLSPPGFSSSLLLVLLLFLSAETGRATTTMRDLGDLPSEPATCLSPPYRQLSTSFSRLSATVTCTVRTAVLAGYSFDISPANWSTCLQ